MRRLVTTIAQILVAALMVGAVLVGIRATRPLDAELAAARAERDRLVEENRDLRAARNALEARLVQIAVEEAAAARVGSRGLTIYLDNEGDRSPVLRVADESLAESRGGP